MICLLYPPKVILCFAEKFVTTKLSKCEHAQKTLPEIYNCLQNFL